MLREWPCLACIECIAKYPDLMPLNSRVSRSAALFAPESSHAQVARFKLATHSRQVRTRLASYKVVSTFDPAYGSVAALTLRQACLASQHASLVCLGLDCIRSLCEARVLHFFKAWAVVARHLPDTPKDPLAAAAWLRLLASAADGAEEEPVKAAAAV